MTGQSASGPVRLLLRAPPHLDFVQGKPGIPAGGNREGARIKGTVEVRLGQQPVKAKWLRVEVRRHETSPSGAPRMSATGQPFEHVGKVHILWKPSVGEWDNLQLADFSFIIPLPTDIPPTVSIPKGGSVRYELVAAVCYKGKGGLFKKDPSSYSQVSEPLTITKYELASAWPAYNVNEVRSVSVLNGQVTMTVDRPSQAFGPGDRILLNASIKSNLPTPFRLRGFDMALVEVLTIFPPPVDPAKAKKNKPPAPPTVKRQTIGTSRATCNIMVAQGGGDKGASLDLQIPTDKPLLTVRNAREFKVEYELLVEATCEGAPGKIILPALECIVGTFARSSAQQAVRDIGFVEGLCPRPPPGAHSQALSTSSVPSSPSASSQVAQLSEATTVRAHQTSASLSGLGRLGPPSAQPGLVSARDFRLSMQQAPSPQPGGQFASRPPPGTGPGDLWRRSSSGTTATTTTTGTTVNATTPGSDFGLPNGRPYNTLPAHNYQRGNVAFPSPQPNTRPHSAYSQDYINGGQRSTSLTRIPDVTIDESGEDALSTRESTYGRIAQSDIGHGHLETQTNRLSDAGGTFGQWKVSEYQSLLDSEVRGGASGSSQASPGRLGAGFPSASNEKQRLYEEALGRAASAQQSHGATLSEIGLEGAGAPPGYFPPTPREPSRTTSPTVSIDSSAATSSAAPPVPPPALSLRSPVTMKPEYLSAAQEKEQQRQRFEAASNRVGGGSSSSNAGTSSPLQNGTPQRVSSPLAASSSGAQQHVDEPIPYDEIYGGSSSSGPSKAVRPPVPAPYKSATQEKDDMRARYEQAQQRVAHTQGTASSQQSSPAASNNGHAGGSSAGPSNGHPPAAYMSAVDEKEMMRKRYEDATNRVTGAGRPTSIAAGPSAGGSASPSAAIAAAAVGAAAFATTAAAARVVSTPPPPTPAAYMSAEEEKAMMRKRFEDAQSAVARTQGGSAGPSAGPLTSVGPSWAAPPASPPPQSPPPTASPPQQTPAYMSAAEEKEMMRRRFEDAQSAVARSQGGGASTSGSAGPSSAPTPAWSPAPPASPPATSPPPVAAPYMSAAEEKEMMRKRFEDAQSAVARTQGGGSAGPSAGPSTSAGPSWAAPPASPPTQPASPPPVTPAYMSAADEKEMMRRRFEDAQSAVARTQAGPPRTTGSPAPARPTSTAPGYMSATDEKDIMRRRYEEATGRVASGSNAAGSSSAAGPSSAAPAPDYMSAADEKEMMRKRFDEAQSRVARTQGSMSMSPVSPPLTTASSPFTPPIGSAFAPAYLSAEEEKEQMRRRYEQATGRVTSGSGSNVAGSSSGSGSSAPAFMSAADEKDMMKKRYEEARSRTTGGSISSPPPLSSSPPPLSYDELNRAASPVTASAYASGSAPWDAGPSSSEPSDMPTYRPMSPVAGETPLSLARHASAIAAKGKQRAMSTLPDGPPPPVPSRPPKEYTTLI